MGDWSELQNCKLVLRCCRQLLTTREGEDRNNATLNTTFTSDGKVCTIECSENMFFIKLVSKLSIIVHCLYNNRYFRVFGDLYNDL